MPKDDEIYIHDAEIKFQVESEYEERPTEKEFLTAMLKLLKHLTANPGQIYSPGIRTYMNTDEPMNSDEVADCDFEEIPKQDSMIWPEDPDRDPLDDRDYLP